MGSLCVAVALATVVSRAAADTVAWQQLQAVSAEEVLEQGVLCRAVVRGIVAWAWQHASCVAASLVCSLLSL
jgi:hypothetical protein